MPGVTSTAVGYSGGHKDNATYRQVCSGGTGHAEVVLVEFDPAKLSYGELLKRFFDFHSPTLSYKPQYRSAIFTFGAEQLKIATKTRDALKAEIPDVVTEVTPASTFWKAEDYHQRYYEKRR